MADRLSNEQINEVKLAFDAYDRDGQGVISSADMRTAIKSLGQSPSAAEMDRIVRDIDTKGGQVNLNTFISIMADVIGQGDSEADLIAAFQCFDKYDEGSISVEDFRHCMTALGDGLPRAEVEKMLQAGGVHGDRLDYRAWIKAVGAF